MLLVGREQERETIDSLLQDAREERSGVLVVRGEPGIGKTALLEYAREQAADMRVLRCVGIEAEHEMPFAGMHELLRPCLGLLDRLPPPQAAALESALGLSSDRVADPFLVSLGALGLLAEASEEAPLLCVVDDAQWLDRRASPDVVRSLVGSAAGNPLALLELPAGLSEGQIEGVEPIVGPPPARGSVEKAFRERVTRLPERTR